MARCPQCQTENLRSLIAIHPSGEDTRVSSGANAGLLPLTRELPQVPLVAHVHHSPSICSVSGKESKARLPFQENSIRTMIYLKDSKIKIQNSTHIAKVFLNLLLSEDTIDQEKEHFYVMHLDIRSRINLVELVSLGTLTSSLVHPRETYRRAVIQGSANIIVAHNRLFQYLLVGIIPRSIL
jgi:hypothetical protein